MSNSMCLTRVGKLASVSANLSMSYREDCGTVGAVQETVG